MNEVQKWAQAHRASNQEVLEKFWPQGLSLSFAYIHGLPKNWWLPFRLEDLSMFDIEIIVTKKDRILSDLMIYQEMIYHFSRLLQIEEYQPLLLPFNNGIPVNPGRSKFRKFFRAIQRFSTVFRLHDRVSVDGSAYDIHILENQLRYAYNLYKTNISDYCRRVREELQGVSWHFKIKHSTLNLIEDNAHMFESANPGFFDRKSIELFGIRDGHAFFRLRG